jgi:hypothetical protein
MTKKQELICNKIIKELGRNLLNKDNVNLVVVMVKISEETKDHNFKRMFNYLTENIKHIEEFQKKFSSIPSESIEILYLNQLKLEYTSKYPKSVVRKEKLDKILSAKKY